MEASGRSQGKKIKFLLCLYFPQTFEVVDSSAFFCRRSALQSLVPAGHVDSWAGSGTF